MSFEEEKDEWMNQEEEDFGDWGEDTKEEIKMVKQHSLCDELVSIEGDKGYWCINIIYANKLMKSLASKLVDMLSLSEQQAYTRLLVRRINLEILMEWL